MSKLSIKNYKYPQPISYKLPTYWACFLFYGDATGMTDDEIAEADKFMKDNALSHACDCIDEGFCHRNDANNVGSDCSTFTFLQTGSVQVA